MQAIYLYSRVLLMLAAAFSVQACGDDESDLGEPVVELGTGALNFESLSDGAGLVLIAGTQGGHHFVVNARIRGLLPGNSSKPNELGNPFTNFAIFDEAGDRIDAIAPPYRLGYRESDQAPWFEMPSGRILRVNQDLIDADPAYLDNLYQREVELRVTVVDASGNQASHAVRIRPQFDPNVPKGGPPDAGVNTADAGP